MTRQLTTQRARQNQSDWSHLTGGTLQRKCASCGNHTLAGDECSECRKKKWKGVQTKLKIGDPDDAYEREADRIADQVMAMPTPVKPNKTPIKVQRFSGHASGEAAEAPPSVERVLNSPGRPLPSDLAEDMGNRFGHDFSDVRIHTGAPAACSARDVNARAYTVGRHIVFADSEFSPETFYGKRLLAHELTHIAQQSAQKVIDRQLRRNHRQTSARRDITSTPRLVLYQRDDAETKEHANSHPNRRHRDASRYFRNLAQRRAEEISAIQLSVTDTCPSSFSVGASPYDSGADIIRLIENIVQCTNKPLQELQIFSHGFLNGYGLVASHVNRRGILRNDRPLLNEWKLAGARHTSDIPVEPFAEDALIVFHGCQIGSGDESFAEELLRRLVGHKPEIRIFAHRTSGNAGNFSRRDWIEFNRQNVDGLERHRREPYRRFSGVVQRSMAPEKPHTELLNRSIFSISGNTDDIVNKVDPIREAPTRLQRNSITEESRLDDPDVASFLRGVPYENYPQQMREALARSRNFDNAQTVANWWGYRLWEAARRFSQQNGEIDDRPLYWTRLSMRRVLRGFYPSFALNFSEREQLIRGFEQSSRGMPTGGGRLSWIPRAKKILISGFDPFGLDDNIRRSNPSGAAVLDLDGQIVRSSGSVSISGQIQGVILPVSFNYFDEGNIERFFRPYLYSPNRVDMIMTISQGSFDFELEEYASNRRNPDLIDNERVQGGIPTLPQTASRYPFIQSSLPRSQMRQNTLDRSPDPTRAEAEFSGREANGDLIIGPNSEHRNPFNLASAVSGSGGEYLSNEVFYRTSLLRVTASDSASRRIPVGHLHVPRIGSREDATQRRSEITSVVRGLIASALPYI